METITRAECQANVNIMNEKMDRLDDKIDDLKVDVAELPQKLIEKLDGRYASKSLEKLIYSTAGALVFLLIGIVGYFFDKFIVK